MSKICGWGFWSAFSLSDTLKGLNKMIKYTIFKSKFKTLSKTWEAYIGGLL